MCAAQLDVNQLVKSATHEATLNGNHGQDLTQSGAARMIVCKPPSTPKEEQSESSWQGTSSRDAAEI